MIKTKLYPKQFPYKILFLHLKIQWNLTKHINSNLFLMNNNLYDLLLKYLYNFDFQ